MLASSLLALALATVGANAIMVTFPGKRDTWSTSGAQTIEWDSVSTDPDSFSIVLVNQDSSYLAKTVTLSDNVSTSSGKTTVTFPGGGDFPAGKSFQVNFLRDRDDSILAQSPMFDIDQSTAAATTAAQTTTMKTTTTAAATTAATGTTTAGSAPQTLSKSVEAAASAASASAQSATESGGVSIPAGNTNGALSSFSSSALLVAVAGVVGAAALI